MKLLDETFAQFVTEAFEPNLITEDTLYLPDGREMVARSAFWYDFGLSQTEIHIIGSAPKPGSENSDSAN